MSPRVAPPDTTGPEAAASRIAAWRESGVAGIDGYNDGLMTQPMLDTVIRSLSG